MKHLLRVLGALFAATLLLAACGGNDSESSEGSGSGESSETTAADEGSDTTEGSEGGEGSGGEEMPSITDYEAESDQGDIDRVIEAMPADMTSDDTPEGQAFTTCLADQMIQAAGVDDSVAFFESDALSSTTGDMSDLESLQAGLEFMNEPGAAAFTTATMQCGMSMLGDVFGQMEEELGNLDEQLGQLEGEMGDLNMEDLLGGG